MTSLTTYYRKTQLESIQVSLFRCLEMNWKTWPQTVFTCCLLSEIKRMFTALESVSKQVFILENYLFRKNFGNVIELSEQLR